MSKNATANDITVLEGEDNKTNVGRFDQAKKTLSTAKDSLTRNAGKLGEGITSISTDATEYAKVNPGKALAIAIGSGVAIGYLIGSATRRNTFWTTISGAVIGAVADRLR
jgi:ElaB/YqjD/DUF883 family membrane-anchored ribosome-binding protein